jgi:Zn-finger nucleic acid-binding protein
MRVLAACPGCARRYDVTGRPVGSRFRCRCGVAVAVPSPDSREAAVVCCSNCGGPVADLSGNCPFCNAAVAAAERDRNTVCPHCFTRVGDAARFCHACGGDLRGAEPVVAGESSLACPACRDGTRLAHRSLANAAEPIDECPRCAGLWLPSALFQDLVQHAQSRSLSSAADGRASRAPSAVATARPGPLYRPCPVCGQLMRRHNFGRVSGVILDSCLEDGVWFDADELPGILRFIEGGGLARTAEVETEERTRNASHRAAVAAMPMPAGALDRDVSTGVDVFRAALDLLGRLFGG